MKRRQADPLIFAKAFERMGIECRALAMGSLELKGQAPSEIHLLPLGKWDGYIHPVLGQMSFEVTPAHVKAAVDYHHERKARGPKRDLVIDYEHQTLSGGPAPAAGWMPELEGRELGLFATQVDWVPKAKKHVEDGEYRYISPVFAFDVLDKVSGKTIPMAVFNAALTNEPFFDELEPIASKDNSLHKLIFIAKETGNMDELLERLRWFLNLPVTATAQDLLGELNKLVGQVKDSIAAEAEAGAHQLLEFLKAQKSRLETVTANYSKVLSTLELKPEATVEEVTARLVSAKSNTGSLTTVTAELNTLKSKVFEKDFDEVIAKGVSTGRITPAQKDDKEWVTAQKSWAETNFKAFSEYFTTKAPQIIPLDQIPISGSAEHQAAGDPQVIAKAAQDYQASEAKAGRHITTTDAVNHVIKKGAK